MCCVTDGSQKRHRKRNPETRNVQEIGDLAQQRACTDDCKTDAHAIHETADRGHDFVAEQRGEGDDEEDGDEDEPAGLETADGLEMRTIDQARWIAYFLIVSAGPCRNSTIWWLYTEKRMMITRRMTPASK